jgi:hypothetical protein
MARGWDEEGYMHIVPRARRFTNCRFLLFLALFISGKAVAIAAIRARETPMDPARKTVKAK